MIDQKKIDCVIGIDVGGTNTKIGLVDRAGNIIVNASIETQGEKPFSEFQYRLTTHIQGLLTDNQDTYSFLAVGMGVPDGNFLDGCMHNPPNFSWKNVPIGESFSNSLDLPVVITNDANAAASGEAHFGKGKELDHFVEITLGTGLGSGIYIDGSVLLGSSGHAGEMGHIIVEPEGRKCECGLSGCLEMYVSNKGIMATLDECLKKYPTSELHQYPVDQLSGEEIDLAYDNGDHAAIDCYHLTGELLGKGLATVVSLLSPEAFIFYGGFSNAGSRILSSAEESMNRHVMDVFKQTVLLKESQLKEGSGAILGSAALAWEIVDGKLTIDY